MTTRLDAVIAARTRTRRIAAVAGARRALEGLRAAGFDAAVIGSLARDDFRVHSDVDILVRGALAPLERRRARRIVGAAMAQTGIGHDVIFLEDLPAARRPDFDRVHLDASDLR
jgi:hypothetical protein